MECFRKLFASNSFWLEEIIMQHLVLETIEIVQCVRSWYSDHERFSQIIHQNIFLVSSQVALLRWLGKLRWVCVSKPLLVVLIVRFHVVLWNCGVDKLEENECRVEGCGGELGQKCRTWRLKMV